MAGFWQIFGKFFALPCVFAFLSCASSRELEVLHDREAAREVLREIVTHDSVVLRDSVFVELRGCTLREVRWRDHWRIMRDVRRDTIRDTVRLADTRTEQTVRVVQKVPSLFKITFLGMAFCLVYMLYNMFCKKK